MAHYLSFAFNYGLSEFAVLTGGNLGFVLSVVAAPGKFVTGDPDH